MSSTALVRSNLVLTVAFVVAVVVAIVGDDNRSTQVAIAVVSIVVFALGIATSLWAYVSALERSRTSELGVANLYLLTGPTAPSGVKLPMLGALALQTTAGVVGAAIGASGLQDGDLNPLAFGVLAPMLGIGMNGLWAVRYGSFGPRLDRTMRPSNKKIR
jgi:hypothetical protein